MPEYKHHLPSQVGPELVSWIGVADSINLKGRVLFQKLRISSVGDKPFLKLGGSEQIVSIEEAFWSS